MILLYFFNSFMLLFVFRFPEGTELFIRLITIHALVKDVVRLSIF